MSRRSSRRPAPIPADVAIGARDVRAGMAVDYEGQTWRVWSATGPERGTCWLVRYVERTSLNEWHEPVTETKTETVAAPINRLARPKVTKGRTS